MVKSTARVFERGVNVCRLQALGEGSLGLVGVYDGDRIAKLGGTHCSIDSVLLGERETTRVHQRADQSVLDQFRLRVTVEAEKCRFRGSARVASYEALFA